MRACDQNLLEQLAFRTPAPIPRFLGELFGCLDSVIGDQWTEDIDSLLLSFARWYQGDFGRYAKELSFKTWPLSGVFFSRCQESVLVEKPLFTRGMRAFFDANSFLSDYTAAESLDDIDKLTFWMIQWGYTQSPLTLIPQELCKDLFNSPSQSLLAAFAKVLSAGREDIAQVLNQGGLSAFKIWWLKTGQAEYSYLTGLYDADCEFKLEAVFDRVESPQISPSIQVNGYFSAVTGLGEDARLSLQTIERVGLKPSQFDLEKGSAVIGSSLAKLHLFTVPGTDFYKSLVKFGPSCFGKGYRIGAWQWELSKWPEAYKPLLNSIDEIWAISPFVREMFMNATSKPITYVPLAVPVVSPQSRYGREHFGIPLNPFVFLVMFDSKSSLKRKNPIAAVRAFYSAFPEGLAEVHLVIKSLSPPTDHPEWLEVLELVRGDSRVTFIIEELPEPEKFGLIGCCDAFVSPHRAEGFGRIIAEAMMLKKPVIVSNYSGNLAFNSASNSYLVDGKIVPLGRNDYWSFQDQVWFEPDVHSIATAMKLCFENESLRERIASSGQRTIIEKHSVQFVSKIVSDRISSLI